MEYRTFEFTITLRGQGPDLAGAWGDAIETFNADYADPDKIPEKYREVTGK